MLAHWHNSPWVDMSLHSNTSSWLLLLLLCAYPRTNKYLFYGEINFFLRYNDDVCFVRDKHVAPLWHIILTPSTYIEEKQHHFVSLWFTQPGIEQMIYYTHREHNSHYNNKAIIQNRGQIYKLLALESFFLYQALLLILNNCRDKKRFCGIIVIDIKSLLTNFCGFHFYHQTMKFMDFFLPFIKRTKWKVNEHLIFHENWYKWHHSSDFFPEAGVVVIVRHMVDGFTTSYAISAYHH